MNSHPQASPNGWRYPFPRASTLVAIALAATLAVGCGGRSKDMVRTGKSVLIFVDKSGSTEEDRDLYARAMTKILSSLRAGDVVRIGTITDRSSTDFASFVECELGDPPRRMNPLADNPLEYERTARRKRAADSLRVAELGVIAYKLIESPSDRNRTAIFETLGIVEQVFRRETRPRKVVIFMSDMIETAFVNLRSRRIDDSFIEKEIARQRNEHLLADLAGVDVWVVGARADDPIYAASIERFWRSLFAAAGATLGPGCYCRVLVNFDE